MRPNKLFLAATLTLTSLAGIQAKAVIKKSLESEARHMVVASRYGVAPAGSLTNAERAAILEDKATAAIVVLLSFGYVAYKIKNKNNQPSPTP